MNDKLKKRASFFMASTLIATSIPTEVIADDINTETQKTAKESTQIKKDIDNEEISNPTNIHSTSDMDIAPKNNNENDDIEENVIIKESDTIDDDQKKVNSNTKDNTESDTSPKTDDYTPEVKIDTNDAEHSTIDQHTDDEIADVPCENLRKVINKYLNRGLITDPVTVKDIESLHGSFSATRMGVTSLKGLEHAKNISFIYINSNQISDLTPLQNLTNLEVISLSDNKVEDITPLQNLTSLNLLDLSGNQVSNITPLEKLVNLSSLNLSDNQISDLTPLEELIGLLSLDLSNNKVSNITPLEKLVSLSSLDLSNNQISDITPLKNTTNLAGINLSNNQVSSITSLQNNTLLNILNLSNNQISDLSTLEKFIILREADLSGNQISNIDALKNTMTLYSLNLNNNQISDITPLKNLAGLGHLYLNNNNISDLTPLANLSNLQTLSLKNQTNSSSESNIEVENDTFNMTYNLKNVDGQLLTNITFPSDNSANGRLEGNNIIWDELKPGSNKVKFTISESVKVGQITTPFTYTASYDINFTQQEELITDWTYENYENGIRLISYIGSSNDIVIPGEMAGKQIYITKETLTSLKDKNSITINEEHGKKAILTGNKDLTSTFYQGKLKSADLRGLDVTGITSMNNMFRSCPNLTSVNMSDWDTSKVTTTYAMFAECPKLTTVNANNWILSSLQNAEYTFYKCSSLITVDTTNWNLSNVTNAQNMFYECSSLITVDTTNWNLSNITNAQNMFYECSSLTTLDTTNWSLSRLKESPRMFFGCLSLTTLDTTNWNLSSLQNAILMFHMCSSLTTLDTSNWNLSNLERANSMFSSCIKLTNLDTSNWNLSNLEEASGMFSSCIKLTNLDTSNWNLSNLKDASGMFSSCIKLTNLDTSNWNLSNLEDARWMFEGCTSLTTLDTSNWNLSNLERANSMFSSCIKLTNLDTSNWNLSNLKDANTMFFGCSNLTTIDISNWNLSNLENANTMFFGCSNLTNLDISNWNLSNLKYAVAMFYGCSNLTNLDTSNWDTSSLILPSAMFYGCSRLTTLDVSNWDTSNMYVSSYMFYGCENLTSIDVSKWDTSKNLSTRGMFSGCKNLINIDVSKWDTSKMYQSSYMFSGCESLTNIDVSKWDTSKLKYVDEMFNNCTKLETVDMSGWKLKEGASINNLFSIAEGETSKTTLLVIAKDPALINYDYKADSRTGSKITLDANGGIFNDNSSTKESDELFTIEDTTQEQVNDIVNNLMEIPTREGYTFKGWETSVTENDTIYRKLNATYKAIWEADKPEKPDDIPNDKPEKPNDTPNDKPEKPNDTPNDKPEKPNDTPNDKPEKPNDTPNGKPEIPGISPTEDKNSPKITLEYNSNTWTNKPITVKVKSSDEGSGVAYIKLPNGKIINSDSVEYTIKTNGTYEFKSVDKSGNISSKVITIENIDTTLPEVSHSITNSNSEAIISILAKDKQSGIKKVTSNNATYLRENTFIAKENGIYTFNIEDKAGNKIEYTVEVSYLSNIKPGDAEIDKDDIIDTDEHKVPEIHINDKVERPFENIEEEINDIILDYDKLEYDEIPDVDDTLENSTDSLEAEVTSDEIDNANKSIEFISEEEYRGSDTSKKTSTKTFTEILNLPKLKIKTDKKASFIENVLYAPIEIEFKDITVYDAPNIKKVPLSSRTTTKENPKSNYKYITIRGEEHVNEKIKDVEFTNDSLTFVTTSGRVTLTIKEYYIMESIKEQLNNDEMKSSINTLSPEQVMDMLRVNKNRKHKPVEIDSYCVINNSKDSELDANFHMNLLKDNNTVEHSNTAIGTIKPNSSTKANSTLSIDTSNIDTGLYELEQTIDLSDGSTKKDTRKVALLSIRTYLMTFIIVGFILASITIYLSSKTND